LNLIFKEAKPTNMKPKYSTDTKNSRETLNFARKCAGKYFQSLMKMEEVL